MQFDIYISMLEKMRDKTRDDLYKNLIDLGIDCELSKRGIRADKLQNPWHRKSLGVIKINSSYPIEFINIIKKDRSKDSPPRWWYYFAIPTDLFYSSYEPGFISFGLHPLTKDGGAILHHQNNLYALFGDTTKSSLLRDWRDILD